MHLSPMALEESGLGRYPFGNTEHHHRLLANARDISLAACDSHNPFPDIHRQLLPARDQLAQGEISAGSTQTGGRGVNATVMLHNDLPISGRGCNSRRLHYLTRLAETQV